MIPFGNEHHLLLTVALNAAVWWCAYRFAKRLRGGDGFSCAVDALLIGFLVQYLSVTLPGLVGLLSAPLMVCVTILMCAGLYSLSLVLGGEGRGEGQNVPDYGTPPKAEHSPLTPTLSPGYGGEGVIAISFFWLVLGYLGTMVYFNRVVPPLGDDGMIYHLPSAMQWLRTGWIGIYDTWFVNPANTYSPLGGSTFMAFLLGTMGNDIAARFCQIPALLLIFFALVEVLRAVGTRKSIAALLAASAVLCRPFVSQAILVKDDLYLAAFFITFVAGCSKERITDRLGPWRLGMSLGLMLAMKYTALFALPLLVFAADAPFRAKWKLRSWLIFLLCASLLAGPWFIRNWIVAGNPLFPIPVSIAGVHIFSGLFSIAKSTEMANFSGVWEAFTNRYHELSPATLIGLLALWLVAVALNAKSLWRDPLKRICLLGSLLGMLIFIFASHAAEIRYTYASLLLLFASVGLLKNWHVIAGLGVVLLLVSLRTIWKESEFDYQLGAIALVIGAIAGGFAWAKTLAGPRMMEGFLLLAGLATALAVYIYWPGYLIECGRSAGPFWENRYGKQGELWAWTRENLPDDAKIAIANTVLPYPLYGKTFARTVEYHPTRRNFSSYRDLDRSWTLKLTDQQIRPWVAGELSKEPDWDRWRQCLRDEQLQYLYVEKEVANPSPIEIDFAGSHPQIFTKLFENEAGAVYQIQP